MDRIAIGLPNGVAPDKGTRVGISDFDRVPRVGIDQVVFDGTRKSVIQACPAAGVNPCFIVKNAVPDRVSTSA